MIYAYIICVVVLFEAGGRVMLDGLYATHTEGAAWARLCSATHMCILCLAGSAENRRSKGRGPDCALGLCMVRGDAVDRCAFSM